MRKQNRKTIHQTEPNQYIQYPENYVSKDKYKTIVHFHSNQKNKNYLKILTQEEKVGKIQNYFHNNKIKTKENTNNINKINNMDVNMNLYQNSLNKLKDNEESYNLADNEESENLSKLAEDLLSLSDNNNNIELMRNGPINKNDFLGESKVFFNINTIISNNKIPKLQTQLYISPFQNKIQYSKITRNRVHQVDQNIKNYRSPFKQYTNHISSTSLINNKKYTDFSLVKMNIQPNIEQNEDNKNLYNNDITYKMKKNNDIQKMKNNYNNRNDTIHHNNTLNFKDKDKADYNDYYDKNYNSTGNNFQNEFNKKLVAYPINESINLNNRSQKSNKKGNIDSYFNKKNLNLEKLEDKYTTDYIKNYSSKIYTLLDSNKNKYYAHRKINNPNNIRYKQLNNLKYNDKENIYYPKNNILHKRGIKDKMFLKKNNVNLDLSPNIYNQKNMLRYTMENMRNYNNEYYLNISSRNNATNKALSNKKKTNSNKVLNNKLSKSNNDFNNPYNFDYIAYNDL